MNIRSMVFNVSDRKLIDFVLMKSAESIRSNRKTSAVYIKTK